MQFVRDHADRGFARNFPEKVAYPSSSGMPCQDNMSSMQLMLQGRCLAEMSRLLAKVPGKPADFAQADV
eukprot:7414477-Lingulodinium_polyedra.AAC.1